MSQQCYGEDELNNLRQVIESEQLWRGMERNNFTARFEEEFGAWLGRKYVLGICSGTCAEETAVAALGLDPGDEVICPASAPIFVSFPVISVGCIPVFADVDPRTMIISPEGIEARITERTRAVMVVHLWGQPAPAPFAPARNQTTPPGQQKHAARRCGAPPARPARCSPRRSSATGATDRPDNPAAGLLTAR